MKERMDLISVHIFLQTFIKEEIYDPPIFTRQLAWYARVQIAVYCISAEK